MQDILMILAHKDLHKSDVDSIRRQLYPAQELNKLDYLQILKGLHHITLSHGCHKVKHCQQLDDHLLNYSFNFNHN